MKVRNIFYLLLPFLLIGLVACSSDSDSKTGGKYTKSQFEGEWCTIEGPVAMILDLKSSSLTGEVYTNLSTTPVLYETLSGPWNYYPDNDILRMQLFHSLTGVSSTEDYKIVKVNSNVLKLREQSTGAEDVFYRMIDGKTMDQGDVFNVNSGVLTGISPSDYSSSNPDIASVDKNGLIRANGQGVAFISVFTETDEMLIIKVKVKGVVQFFVEEAMSTIEDVLAKHGTPDLTGQYEQNQAVLYKQPSSYPYLSALQYQYDESTREVTRILTIYNDQVNYKSDSDFIIANYYDHDKNLYGENAEFTSNNYLISPFVSEGVCYISYNNFKYFRLVGHY